jgi:ribosomal protein L3 glutamine methyltransferase
LTLAELVADAARRLAGAPLFYGHGTDNPRDEAAYLVLRGLALPFDSDLRKRVSPAQAARIDVLVRRRIRERLPVAYLLREAWLDGRTFYVDRRVIVPRSHIAELLHGKLPVQRVERILDLCTGSGCLAVLAALALPRARVDASDISPAALVVVRKNVERYDLQRRISVVRSDLFAALKGERYDLILANPPYVAAPAMRRLPAEYRHEPEIALVAGRSGLDFVARIIEQAPAHLTSRGALICEVGENRRALERAYPRLPLIWPKNEVFIFSPARTALGPRTRSTRARAAR